MNMKNPIKDELDILVNSLRDHLHTYPGLRQSAEIQPYTDTSLLNKEIALVNEMTAMIQFDSPLSFTELDDTEGSLKQAELKGIRLNGEELFNIGICLDIWQNILSYLEEKQEKYPGLWDCNKDIKGLPFFRDDIFNKIDPDGQVRDNASAELKKIRKRKGSIRADIEGRMRKLMETDDYKASMQDKIVTQRDGRYVLPLKSSGRSRVPGIVHSFSQSGETAFVEPEALVSLNNELVEIDQKEAAEIRRILTELTDTVRTNRWEIAEIDNQIGVMEWIQARSRYALRIKGCFPRIEEKNKCIHILQAFHPLLTVEDPVRIDIHIDEAHPGLIISGPNAGGKTVALKTAGLLVMMLMYAIPLPLHPDSTMSLFHAVYAEIGDEQSIDRNLSSFSGHVMQIAAILEAAGPGDLVLIDEIAAATDPREGEALGREVIRAFIQKGPLFIITTHYSGIKELAYSHESLENAFVEFDEINLQPLYRLFPGGTGSSFALDIARRYGIAPSIIREAQKYLEETMTRNEKLVQTLEKERNSLGQMKEKAAAELREARRLKRQVEQREKDLAQAQEEVRVKGIKILQGELDNALREVSQLKTDLKNKSRDALNQADAITQKTRILLEEEKKTRIKLPGLKTKDLQPGQAVYVASLNKEGHIESVKDSAARVRIGIVSVTVALDDLFESAKQQKELALARSRHEIDRDFKYSLDLRGQRMEDALKSLEKDLDMANMQGAHSMEIIHGKGEGILRKAIWDYLRDMPYVKTYQYAPPREGGQGKTVVEFKS